MNTHKNARLTFARRMQLVRSVVDQRLDPAVAAAEQGVSVPTAKKWLGRYLAEGEAGLMDRSSRPRRSPRSISASQALLIVELRRRLLIQARIAKSVGRARQNIQFDCRHGRLAHQPPNCLPKRCHLRPNDRVQRTATMPIPPRRARHPWRARGGHDESRSAATGS